MVSVPFSRLSPEKAVRAGRDRRLANWISPRAWQLSASLQKLCTTDATMPVSAGLKVVSDHVRDVRVEGTHSIEKVQGECTRIARFPKLVAPANRARMSLFARNRSSSTRTEVSGVHAAGS